MSALNQVIIEGNAVKDSSVKDKPWGTKFGVVTIAVNHYYKDRKGEFASEVGYYDVHVYGDMNLHKLVKNGKKGSPLRVIGRLKQERWETKDGKKTSRSYIVAQHLDFLKRANKENTEKNTDDKEKVLANLKESYSGILSELNDTENSITVNEEEATF